EFEAAWHELQAALDEELRRLPEKYRAPLLLCYLEGQTHTEAARQLGWPLGTVKGRLARARDLLRRRLTQRGLTLSAGPFAALPAVNTSRAAVPPLLFAGAVKGALASPGERVGPAVALAEGARQGASLLSPKILGLMVLVVCALGAGAGVLLLRPP